MLRHIQESLGERGVRIGESMEESGEQESM